jgi:hypothetical protein
MDSMPPPPPPRLFELLEAEEPRWLEILDETCNIEAARYVHPETKLTPLHLAVMAKDADNNESRLGCIRSMLQSNLQSTEVTCQEHGYTPLVYACIANDIDHLPLDVPVVKVLLEYNKRCFQIRSKAGHSALDIHIMSMSRLMQQQQQQQQQQSGGKSPSCSTLVLKALTQQDLGISIPRSLDLLLACNSRGVLERVAREEAQSFAGRLRDRRKQRKSPNVEPPLPPGSRFRYWVWDFVLTILRSEHEHTYRDIKPVPPFNALHTASQIADFPLPFMMLCLRAYPAQARTPSIVQSELPIHSVAGWDVSDSMVARKSMTLTQMVSDHPRACRVKNRQGKTPCSLALETGTGWDFGVRRLSEAQKEEGRRSS